MVGLSIEFIRVVQSRRLSEVSVTSKKILLPSNENHTCGHRGRVCLPLRSHRRVNDLVPEPHGLYLLDKQQNFFQLRHFSLHEQNSCELLLLDPVAVIQDYLHFPFQPDTTTNFTFFRLIQS
jgi:hypothetical protein